jgi:RNA polymerase sigma factor (sigma-70 family)
MTTALISSDRPAWQVDRYVEAVRDEVVRAMVKRHGRFDADDIASDIIVKLFARIDEFMERYPNPVVFARAVCGNGAVDFFRKENAQRGAGARNKRAILCGDAPQVDTGLCFFDVYDEEGADIADVVADDLERRYRWAEIALGIPADEWEAVRLTCVEGYTDAEAAAVVGVTRECLNRRKNAGKRRIKELLA